MYEVRTNTWCDGWVNAWSVGDRDEDMVPQTFETIEEAQKEINEHVDDVNYGRRLEGLEEDETDEGLGIFDCDTGEPV